MQTIRAFLHRGAGRALTMIPLAFALIPLPSFAQTTRSPSSTIAVVNPNEIQSIIDNRVAEKRTVGIIVGVRDARGTWHIHTAGASGRALTPFNGDSIFEIGSVTKSFTGALLAQMTVRRDIRLDDPVSSLLPKSVKVPERNGRQITLLDLATHTSGLPFLPANLSPDVQTSWAQYTDQEFQEFLSSYTLPRDPGAAFQYSDAGYGLLGYALALRAGQTWEQALLSRVLLPLGLHSTRQTLTPDMRRHLVPGHDKAGREVPGWEFNSLPGVGALKSSVNDLIRYLDASLSPPSTALGRALASTQLPRRQAFSAKTQSGLGWFIGIPINSHLIFHGGSTPGYNSFVGFDPSRRVAAVVLANSDTDILDIGLHLLDPAATVDDGPPVIVALHIALVNGETARALEIVSEWRQKNGSASEKDLSRLANRLLTQDRGKQAIAVLQVSAEMHPNSSQVFESLGSAYEQSGERGLARQSYTHALELDPRNAGAQEALKRLANTP